MKKIIVYGCLIFGIIFATHFQAKAQGFQEGDVAVNAGIGLATTYSTPVADLNMPFGGGFEYGIADLTPGLIGVGGEIGYVSGGDLDIFYIGGKGSYHFNELLELENDDVDLYGGIGLYYRNFSYSEDNINFGNDVVASFHLGGRYYFANNIGGYAEIGNNWAWLNIGAVVKL
ncbi:hypothetical protein [Fodinibius salsisoli]|uniref:Outer membrane protein beta-barrel domain-containing protein n=1 Tax=Fodinibius salsisoli TaxID=2820877 RepID=A0ABT3PQW9_9BACT|nr:hypothetical protein [Fodinibius salsisoli]MCW9708253.1 hypothetical protein [Fodinibius salsisoli]